MKNHENFNRPLEFCIRQQIETLRTLEQSQEEIEYLNGSALIIENIGDVLKLNITKGFTKIIHGLLGSLDFSKELRTVNINYSSTSAGELLIRLEPPDRLRSIFPAILTGNVNTLIVEHNKLHCY